MVITFGIILFFTSIKEAIEDHKRYKKDKKSNDKKYSYFNDITSDNKAFERKKSKNIHVGEILRIYKDEELPADLCLLKSSNKNGVCFIDTVNLDGESNLKDKKSVLVTQSLSDYEVCTLNAVIKCDKPNDQLDYWEGYMTVFRSGGEIKTSVK